ncbi:MAG: hypothetical protein JW881_20965 [Spirochaetales bacterium]|nr:hypothetical protein [Spirochaetales bacterium]
MIQSDPHEFHFIITDTMKEKLRNLHLFRTRISLSRVIVGIISIIDPLIVKEHQWGKQRMSRYRPVSLDRDEIREHVHVYFPEDVYRKIKLLHADLNCYSIAQLLRGLLELFFAMVEKYGNKVIEEFEKRFKQWSSEENSLRQSLQRNLRQLSMIIQHLPGRNGSISMYTSHYLPFWILRL